MAPSNDVLNFDEALQIVLSHAEGLPKPATESADLLACHGRILAETVAADRDQPPFDRSTRDGFAVHAADALTGSLHVVGQVRAGDHWQGRPLQPGTAIEIMTGAPIPPAADAVVMVEHITRSHEAIRLAAGRTLRPGENIVPRGKEARLGDILLTPGAVMEAAEIALAAACGRARLTVCRQPTVAIVATGDELVELDASPQPRQIRNSNSYALAALVERAGAIPRRLPIAPDRRPELEAILQSARTSDLLLLSGGVSMGEYDLVEEVLLNIGAEFFFTGVTMQPGKPVVFGRLPATTGRPAQYLFGLPGNPISTQVTFHCFVEPLLRAICGEVPHGPRFVQATLTEAIPGKPGLMRILPARLKTNRTQPQVTVTGWQGSGDLAANARANCYAVLPPDKEIFSAGDVITILLR